MQDVSRLARVHEEMLSDAVRCCKVKARMPEKSRTAFGAASPCTGVRLGERVQFK